MKIVEISTKIKENIGTVIFGKDEIIEKILVCLIAGGHILLEDIPGTGKTTLAKALATSTDCEFKRVQFTPDLLPSDLTGINFFNQKTSEFVFRKGSVFSNILLADEINRATPRTQSSLLECMEERQATIDSNTYKLDPPFIVIATQNPIETQGTFPLPEAQLDRFLMRLSLGYPDVDYEKTMLTSQIKASPISSLTSVVTREEIIEAQKEVGEILVSDNIKKYIVDIATATRNNEKIRLGVSPRGSLALMRAAQAYAGIKGRDYVLPDDVKHVAPDVLVHRIISKGYSSTTETSRKLIESILTSTSVLEVNHTTDVNQ